MERKKSKVKFVNLHGHSTFSVFDGLGYPGEHMDFAYENGSDALALTDHGTMSGFSYQFFHSKKMKKEGKNFKPIYGCEVYYVESLDEWKKVYEESKKNKKSKIKNEIELSIEDEEASKKAEKNFLKKRSHLILLAATDKGLKNLFKIVSLSYQKENFYKFPRIDFEILKKYSEGLIVSSACLGGLFAKIYWEKREEGYQAVQDEMERVASSFKEVFQDRFYGELQWNGYKEQHELNKHVINCCSKLGIELISTADSHYPRPELSFDRDVYKMFGYYSKKQDIDMEEQKTKKSLCELYPKNGDEMWESYKRYSGECGFSYDDDLVKKSIENTHRIAFQQIQNVEPDTSIKLPEFLFETEDSDLLLEKLTREGLKKLGKLNKKYEERLKTELKVIKDQNFSKYFLTMNEIAKFASERQLTGCGRGSAAGSLISYSLGITQVDPLKYGLLFSRFLRSDAKGMPDIDFDCSNPMELKEELIKQWGENNVIPISNFNKLKLKSLIKDIARLYKVPFSDVNKVTSVMIEEATPQAKIDNDIKSGVYNPSFEEVVKYSPTLQKFFRKYPEIEERVNALQGQIRSCSRHAGGCLIAQDLDSHMPLINNGGVTQTPWSEGQDVRHLEPLGFIKFDILGLSSLRMFEDCIRMILKKKGEDNSFSSIRKFYDENMHPDHIDLDDQNVYKNIYHKDSFAGIFQFTESGAQNFCLQVKPKSIIDLASITSICRPGPLAANVHRQYLKAKEDPSSISYLHPILKDITEDTYGFLIFQEQIAMIAHKMGKNISLDEGNKLRKLLTKKGTGSAAKEKKNIYDKFIIGCDEKGIGERKANELWELLEYFNGYGFNLSHAVCYSIVSYQCAWLMTYFQDEWMAAFLQKESDKPDKMEKAINIVKSLGYKITPPDVNTSGKSWEAASDKTLLQPLTTIKGVAEQAVENIIEARPFKKLEDLLFSEKIIHRKVNKKVLDALARSGALNSIIDDRFKNLKHFWKSVVENKPKSIKKLNENIENFKEVDDFSKEEYISFKMTLTGSYPAFDILSKRKIEKLEEMKVPSIGNYNKLLKICWFIVKDFFFKKTKNNKDYMVVVVTDHNNNERIIRCWGVNPKIDVLSKHTAYMSKLDKNNFGFSSYGINKSWVKI